MYLIIWDPTARDSGRIFFIVVSKGRERKSKDRVEERRKEEDGIKYNRGKEEIMRNKGIIKRRGERGEKYISKWKLE